MARKTTTTIGVISSSKRLKNSVNGNPRYEVRFDDGEIHTSMSDASWVYAFGNPGYRVGDRVKVELTEAGRIAHMESAPE